MTSIAFKLTSTVRLKLPLISSRMICTNTSFPTFLQVSAPLLAEPMKKKKKMDPQVIKAREERKKKRIEKTIKKLERNTKQLKPLEEIDLPINLQKEKWMRDRRETIPQVELEKSQVLLKSWCTYKYRQHFGETKMIDRILLSQSHALEHIRTISEELYIGAIQMDNSLVPFAAIGPHSTPPIDFDYEAQDGEYIDETPKWN